MIFNALHRKQKFSRHNSPVSTKETSNALNTCNSFPFDREKIQKNNEKQKLITAEDMRIYILFKCMIYSTKKINACQIKSIATLRSHTVIK